MAKLVKSELTGSVHGKSYLEESLDSDDSSSIDSSLPFTNVMGMKCFKANDVLAHPENSPPYSEDGPAGSTWHPDAILTLHMTSDWK